MEFIIRVSVTTLFSCVGILLCDCFPVWISCDLGDYLPWNEIVVRNTFNDEPLAMD